MSNMQLINVSPTVYELAGWKRTDTPTATVSERGVRFTTKVIKS